MDRVEGYPCGDQSPLVTPVDENAVQSELFVVHRAAIDIYREQLSESIVETLGYPTTYQPEVFQAVRDIGEIQLKATMVKLLGMFRDMWLILLDTTAYYTLLIIRIPIHTKSVISHIS